MENKRVDNEPKPLILSLRTPRRDLECLEAGTCLNTP